MLPNVFICMFFVISLFGYLTTLSVLIIVIGSQVQASDRLRILVRNLREIEEKINMINKEES